MRPAAVGTRCVRRTTTASRRAGSEWPAPPRAASCGSYRLGPTRIGIRSRSGGAGRTTKAEEEEYGERKQPAEQHGVLVRNSGEDRDDASQEPEHDHGDGLEPAGGCRPDIVLVLVDQPVARAKPANEEVEARQNEADGGRRLPYSTGIARAQAEHEGARDHDQPDQADRGSVTPCRHGVFSGCTRA